ncbi:ankyrin repeat-containing domain protein [Xylaria arbuscula]|nr:ankyrin repeat-containing domain protein [Xylaria arbuscula]
MLERVKGEFRHRARRDNNEERGSGTKANIATATAEEASANGPASLDQPSTSGLPPVQTPEALSPEDGLNLKPVPIPVDSDTPIRELWDLAYTNLRREDERLVVEYEGKLCGDLGAGVASVGSKRMDTILRRKMDKVNEDAWKLKFGTSEVQVRDLVQPILGVVERANGFIKAAVSADPSASLAWAGVSVLLPLFLNPSKQVTSLVKGLDYISSLISQSRMWEDLYVRQDQKSSKSLSHAPYKTELEKLYRHILKFQATSYCYYAKHTFSRVGMDIVKWNGWDSMLEEIKEKELAFSKVCDIWRDIKYDEECSAAAHRHREAIGHWQDIGMGISGLQEAVREAQREKHRRKMIGWLCSVDPSRIYNVARGKHQSGTGDWLLESEKFQSWQKSPKSLLWLHGQPGCGKSVLSSSVIKQLQKEYSSNPGSPIAYFFFSFSDRETQKVIKDLDTYKEKHQSPDMETLENALIDIANGFSSVSLIIDALDECPSINEERKNLLESLHRIVAKMPDNLHIFLTSRLESEIRTEMYDTFAKRQDSFSYAMDLTSRPEGVNRDIGLYIDSTLAFGKFKLWPANFKTKAKDVLLKRADGMFQYVVCQFDVLKKYHSPAEIDDALEKLPFGLNETYDRILKNIDKEFLAQNIILLKWLVASVRPLSVEELSEACIIRPERDVPFDARYRQFGPQECIIDISSLIVQYEDQILKKRWEKGNKATFVRLAHFSVEEYLTSNPSVDSELAAFFFTKIDAHLLVAHSSLIYHLHRSTLHDEEAINLPLADYAQENWMSHLELVPRESWPNDLVRLAARALTPGSKSVFLMITSYYEQVSYNWRNTGRTVDTMIQQPLYWVARLGLLKLTEMLLPGSPWANKYLGERDLDAALEEAAFKGGVKIIQLLLDRGAHVNAASKILRGALRAAVFTQNVPVVNLLLDNDADVNSQHGLLGTTLGTAVSVGDIHLVKLLVSRGADVRLPPNKGESILASAVKKQRSIEILQYLLDSGADINGQDRTGATALHAASCVHADAHFRLLLERGADVNGGSYGNAFQAAVSSAPSGDLSVVELLLEKGANINAQGGGYGNALQAAACEGDVSVVELLLEKGADVNAQGGAYDNALLAACLNTGCMEVIKLLLDRGADVNAQGSKFGSALQAACSRGRMEVIELLLTWGADMNGSGGCLGTPLQATASCDTFSAPIKKILELLLSKGAEVNGQAGKYGTALQAACFQGNITAVRVLLNHGADVNIHAGEYGTALQAVCSSTDDIQRRADIVRLLIEHGANIQVEGGYYGSAWHAAVATATAAWVYNNDTEFRNLNLFLKLLLSYGADINGTQGRVHATTLQAVLESTWSDYILNNERRPERSLIDVIRFLLDHGANVNIKAGKYGFPLQSACANKMGAGRAIYLLQHCSDLDINAAGGIFGSALQAAAYSGQANTVKLLLEKGADPDARGGKYRSALNAAVLRGFWYIVEMLLDHGAIPDRHQLLAPDEEWLDSIQEEGLENILGEKEPEYVFWWTPWGPDHKKWLEDIRKEETEHAVERYRIFWERQPADQGAT